jgi:hypothetical protein
MQRTIQTATKINAPKEQWKALNEINAVKKKICLGIYYLKFTLGYM